jgi:hypothetical protein
MGVHVILDIDPSGIDPSDWAAVHDETLGLLEAWTPRLLGWRWRTIEGVKMPMYARSLRHWKRDPKKTYWQVVGDRESFRTAECQSLHRNLARSTKGRRAHARTNDDILLFASGNKEDSGGPVRVFGDKTQGHPYHFAVLAAAMVVEERFPKHAMVWGDIDRGQAEEARRLAAPILGREVPLPVRVDAPRLLERLGAVYDGDALTEAFERLFLDDPTERHEAVLRAFAGERGERWWLKEYTTSGPRTLGALGLLIAWFNAGRDLATVCRLACLDPTGPRLEPEVFVDSLAATWVAIPRPKREALDVFRKPSGASHTVMSMLGGFMLDMSVMGRKTRVHIEPQAIRDALGAIFGGDGDVWMEKLRERTAEIEHSLERSRQGVRSLVERGNARVKDDPDELPRVRSAAKLGPDQRLHVQAITWSVGRSLARLRDEGPEVSARLDDVKTARSLLVRALREQGPTLSERAWDVLLTVEDPAELNWLFALATMPYGSDTLARVRQALFEVPQLRAYAIAVGKDPVVMAEISARMKKFKAGSS